MDREIPGLIPSLPCVQSPLGTRVSEPGTLLTVLINTRHNSPHTHRFRPIAVHYGIPGGHHPYFVSIRLF